MSKYTKIRLGLINSEAKQDCTLNAGNIQFFSNTDDLKSDYFELNDYATLEKNYFVLDGNKSLIEEPFKLGTSLLNPNQNTGICSLQISDESGLFETTPKLEITLPSEITVSGLTVTFGKYDYCSDLDITYYLNDEIVNIVNFKPDNIEFYCGNDNVEYTFNKIIIEFKATSNPYRFLKLTQIEFGSILTFADENVVSCNILEELDLISNELSINTCEFEIYSDDDKFNILNPQGLCSKLKTKLPIEVYQEDNVEKTSQFMGKFYLKSWESTSEKLASFECEDAIGLLEDITYTDQKDTYNYVQSLNWRYYMRLTDFLEDVFTNTNLTYEVVSNDDDRINGLILSDTLKNILQKGLFTFGYLADTSRSEVIKIFKLENNVENLKTIEANRIFLDTLQVSKSTEYNQVVVYGYDYDGSVANNATSNEVYSPSEDTIEGTEVSLSFDKPQSFNELWTNSVGIPLYIGGYFNPISNVTPFKITFTVGDLATATLTSITQQENKTAFTYQSTTKTSDEGDSVLTVDECELIHADSNGANYITASKVAERLYNHYKDLYRIEFEFEFDGEQVGDYVAVETEYGRKIIGNIISLDIDLILETATATVEGRVSDE